MVALNHPTVWPKVRRTRWRHIRLIGLIVTIRVDTNGGVGNRHVLQKPDNVWLEGASTLGRWKQAAVLILPAAVLIAGCQDSGVDAQPGASVSTTSASAAPSPTVPVAPEAQPAVAAYRAFNDAASAAALHPFGSGDKVPADADFTKFSFDPIKSQYRILIWGLADRGWEYRGTPPQTHADVKSIHLKANPYPTVTLTDCQSGTDKWLIHDAKTGAVQPQATGKVPPPNPSTVTMILYKKSWGVSKIDVDTSRTCTP